mgnify:CR=1 FL=1
MNRLVVIHGKYSASSDGPCQHSAMYAGNYKGQLRITRVLPGTRNPYLVSDAEGPIGWFPESGVTFL